MEHYFFEDAILRVGGWSKQIIFAQPCALRYNRFLDFQDGTGRWQMVVDVPVCRECADLSWIKNNWRRQKTFQVRSFARP